MTLVRCPHGCVPHGGDKSLAIASSLIPIVGAAKTGSTDDVFDLGVSGLSSDDGVGA